MTPGDLYRSCRYSIYRLEVQQTYLVPGDDERQRAFHAGEPLPPPRPEKVDDLRLITELTDAGKRLVRVHVVTWPLSDYVRYELAVYAENAAAGEDVRIADAARHPPLSELETDCVIADWGHDPKLIAFDYSANGALNGYRQVENTQMIDRLYAEYQVAYDHAVPLADFTAAHERALTR